jgi:hypothetical protein
MAESDDFILECSDSKARRYDSIVEHAKTNGRNMVFTPCRAAVNDSNMVFTLKNMVFSLRFMVSNVDNMMFSLRGLVFIIREIVFNLRNMAFSHRRLRHQGSRRPPSQEKCLRRETKGVRMVDSGGCRVEKRVQLPPPFTLHHFYRVWPG